MCYLSFGCSLHAQTSGLLLPPFVPQEVVCLPLLIARELVSPSLLRGATLPRWGVRKWMCLLNLMVIFCQPTFPLGLSHWLPNAPPDCGFVYCAKKLQLSILREILLQRI